MRKATQREKKKWYYLIYCSSDEKIPKVDAIPRRKLELTPYDEVP